MEKEWKLSTRQGKKIYLGTMIVSGGITGILTFSANKFMNVEIVLITLVGIVIGYGLALVIEGILEKIQKH